MSELKGLFPPPLGAAGNVVAADQPCPFCQIADTDCLVSTDLARAFWDRYPVSPGHVLVVPRRHVTDWFEMTTSEQAAVLAAASAVREILEQHQPDGYNLGVNSGAAAGQTVPHVHLHVIPRYLGDVADPRGGVRYVLPAHANYLAAPAQDSAPHEDALIRGEADPLLPHLAARMSRAHCVDIAAAFVMVSGVRLLLEHFRDVIDRGGRVRLLTGDYLDVTDPVALRMLLDLGPAFDLRVFESGGASFHPKSYICVNPDGTGTAFVGSSNVSQSALRTGIEWNYRIVGSDNHAGFQSVRRAFEQLIGHECVVTVTPEWIDRYEVRRRVAAMVPAEDAHAIEPAEPIPIPHEIQREALQALASTRSEGNEAGLVVLATGLGKTWLAAFDVVQARAKRVLFVAHREEILDQAIRTFRLIRPEAHLGKYTGTEKVADADVVFASIQTLGRRTHLERFSSDAFDYIVVDEFHHASAATYRRLLDHFTPRFLLGLTATPERADGADLLALCGENLVYRADVVEGVRRGLLSPFDYYGVPDDVDYAQIPWRSSRFDEEALTTAVATTARADNALDQLRRRGGQRTIAFCVSQRHADFMRRHFQTAGLRTAAVHSGISSDPRAQSLEQLQTGELDVLFAVDMFNEGVDVPDIDTVLMLRPTESPVLWMQQFGRGLRWREGKRLKVIDYIGNHRVFLLKPRMLFQLGDGDAQVSYALKLLEEGSADQMLPPGCSVTYDLVARDILRALLRPGPESLELFYRDFRERTGARPTATETFHARLDPKAARRTYGSWFEFIRVMGDLRGASDTAEVEMRDLLKALEITPMTRSFKMVLLIAMLADGAFPGSIAVDRLLHQVRSIARRSAILRSEFGDALADDGKLLALLEEHPIAAWVEGHGTGGARFFGYDPGERVFSTTFTLAGELREATQAMVRELAEWRLAVYLNRTLGESGADRIVCRVSHSGDRPILFLPSRDKFAGIPEGWVDVVVDGEPYHANFAKVAVNVLRRAGEDDNVLGELMRRWFGPSAGGNGTVQMVEFARSGEGYFLAPLSDALDEGARVWASYVRAAVPKLFGFEFKGFESQSGIVERSGLILLFVTLDKTSKPKEHQYEDGFVSPDEFRWQSQNRTRQDSRVGRELREHAARGTSVHLFVRAAAKDRNGTQPFTYCGPLTFERWEGENPITVWWRLAAPVPERLWNQLRVPAPK